MKLVTVIFAAFAYICSSSVSVGAQIWNEFQSKYNQTSVYDIFGVFLGIKVHGLTTLIVLLVIKLKQLILKPKDNKISLPLKTWNDF